MLNKLKNGLEKLPGGNSILKLYKKVKFSIYYPLIRGKEQLFTDYYFLGNWTGGGEESRSGAGSTVSYTEPIRNQLPSLISELKIDTLLDAPCGDFNWFRLLIDEIDISYIGGDTVEPMIEKNRKEFSGEKVTFQHLDITRDSLPNADIWFCRDCLIHFSNKDIKRAMRAFLESDIPYLLTTTYSGSKVNKNILTGEHRFLNLELAPFNFCTPVTYIDDWVEGFPVKKMGLWRKDQIEDSIRTWIN